MMLYRGTKPTEFEHKEGLFRTEGLLARVTDGGDPTHVEDIGIANAVQEHVNGTTPGGRSSFLSFTTSWDVAMRYAWSRIGGKPERMADDAYGERAIVFVMDTTGAYEEADAGVLRLEYRCDYKRIWPNTPDEGPWTAEAVECLLCEGRASKRLHTMRLINVATYLRAHPHLAPSKEAIALATRDAEWLAYPMDFIPDLKGYEFRIPPSRIWTAELYRRAEQ